MTLSSTPSEAISVVTPDDVATDARWIDARQAAQYTCLSATTIRKACKRGGLQHIRLGRPGGPIRTRTEWVHAWMMRWVHVPASE